MLTFILIDLNVSFQVGKRYSYGNRTMIIRTANHNSNRNTKTKTLTLTMMQIVASFSNFSPLHRIVIFIFFLVLNFKMSFVTWN